MKVWQKKRFAQLTDTPTAAMKPASTRLSDRSPIKEWTKRRYAQLTNA